MKLLCKYLFAVALLPMGFFSDGAHAALVITSVSVTAPTSVSSGLITVTGDCVVGGGNTSLLIKPLNSGPTWTLLGAGAGNCSKSGPKTKTVKYNQPPGNYKIRIAQGVNFFNWPAIVILP